MEIVYMAIGLACYIAGIYFMNRGEFNYALFVAVGVMMLEKADCGLLRKEIKLVKYDVEELRYRK